MLMKPVPASWTEKKRYLLVLTTMPWDTLLTHLEGVLGSMGMARMRPVLVREDSWEGLEDARLLTVRVNRGSETAFRFALLNQPGFARLIVMSGTLRGLRRKAREAGFLIGGR